MRVFIIYLLLLSLLSNFNVHGQSAVPITPLVTTIDSFALRMPAEKVYLHIDKPYYSNTDTIWLQAYILNGELEGSKQSGLLYTELVNDTGRVVLRQAMPVLMGISWGQIAIDSTIVSEGAYTLRAYTNWMQNIGEAGFFTRQLYISKADGGSWLVNAGSKTSSKGDRENTEVALQLLGQDGDPVRLQDLQVKLTDGSKTRLREKMQTDIEGKIRFNFDVPPKAGRLTLVAEEKNGKRIVVPLNLAGEVNADVQFMPEGGSLVAGLTSKVGFKAIAEDGKGIDISGIVIDSKKKEVAAFKSVHKGIGFFLFTPINNETYTAKVTFPNGLVKSYVLPAIKPSGMVLMVNNIPCRDSIMLAVQVSADIAAAGSRSYSLIAQSRGRVCFASVIKFKDSITSINGRVAKSKFPSGVVRFTLFGSTNQPVAERIIFIDHHDGLQISLDTGKTGYQPKDSVSLAISVTNKDSKPVQGSFSVAVTDDSQVKADSTNVPNISNYMLLQSELKGNIEEPGYYFDNPTPAKELQLDNLLLTQGWVGYDWNTVFNKAAEPKFRAEREIAVSGRITKISGKPIAGIRVNLLSTNKPLLFMDTVTNNEGRFIFTNLPHIDTAAFMVQLKDNKRRMFEANINLDEFTAAGTAGIDKPSLVPWYVNSDTTLLNYNRQNIALQKELQKIKFPSGTVLKEVVIKGRKVIKGSKFYAGYGGVPDLVIDEKEMINAKKTPIEDLLIKRVSGFGQRLFQKKRLEYMVNDNLMYLYIDGFEVERFYYPPAFPGPNEHFNYIRSFLTQLTAEDVKGIEVKTGMRMIILTDEKKSDSMARVTYIEITTWSGNGAFMKRTHGRALYRPLPVSWPKEFYKPKYSSKPDPLLDLRSTLYWQPGIITDEQGKARVSFFTKSVKAAYTIIIQGADMNGATGYKRVLVRVPPLSGNSRPNH